MDQKTFLDFTFAFDDLTTIHFVESPYSDEGFVQIPGSIKKGSDDERRLRSNIREIEKYEKSKQE